MTRARFVRAHPATFGLEVPEASDDLELDTWGDLSRLVPAELPNAHCSETGLTARSQNWQGMSYQQIGEKLGLTGERVRQIEAEALQKLRRAFKRLGVEVTQ